MFLQRMIAATDDSGTPTLNYDCMGSAEFEGGVTATARIALSETQMAGRLSGKHIRLFAKWGVSTYGPVDVAVFGDKAVIERLGTNPSKGYAVGDLLVSCEKENARLDNDRIIGWLNVSPLGRSSEPLLFLRAGDENVKRGSEYLNFMIRQILEAQKEKADV